MASKPAQMRMHD